MEGFLDCLETIMMHDMHIVYFLNILLFSVGFLVAATFLKVEAVDATVMLRLQAIVSGLGFVTIVISRMLDVSSRAFLSR